MEKSRNHYEIQIGLVGHRSKFRVLIRRVCEKLGHRLHVFESFPDFPTSALRPFTLNVLIVDEDSFAENSVLREWGRKLGTLRPSVLAVFGGQASSAWLTDPLPSCIRQFVILDKTSERLESLLANILRVHSEIPILKGQTG